MTNKMQQGYYENQLPSQQQQVGAHANHPLSAPTNPQSLMQQQQQQNAQTVVVVGHQDNPEQSTNHQYTTPNCSPELSALQYAQSFQHLEPVPQQPLFQDQAAGQQHVVGIDPPPTNRLAQQHAARLMHHQAMQHQQQLQQQACGQQQLPPMPQTPILYSNANAVAQGNSPVAIKKGRFRVVKGGAANEGAKPPPPLEAATAMTTTTTTSDNQSAAANNEANDADAMPQPLSTVKKGRFVVKKAAVPPSASSGRQDDVEKSSKANAAAGVPPFAGEATESVTASARDGGNEQRISAAVVVVAPSPSSAQTTQPPSEQANVQQPCTKQKGRFLVKTGGGGGNGASNSPSTDAASKPAVAIAGGAAEASAPAAADAMARLPPTAETVPRQQPRQQQNPDGMTTAATGAIAADDADNLTKGNATGGGSDVKKKGRFVVKTGGIATTAGMSNAVPSSAPDGARVVIQNANHQQLPNNYAVGGVPVPPACPPATSVVDANAHAMTQTIQQHAATPTTQMMQQQQLHPIQQVPAPQQTSHVQCQFTIPSILSGVSSIGSASSAGSQQNQKPPPPPPPQSIAADAHPHLPLAHRQTLAEARLPESVLSKPVNGASSQPPAAGNSAGWIGGTRGKNGRMIGGGGVGKVLHYLETMRTEVVEADRCITSLQSDNRFLVSYRSPHLLLSPIDAPRISANSTEFSPLRGIKIRSSKPRTRNWSAGSWRRNACA